MVVEQRMTVEPLCWGGGGTPTPLQLTTGLVVNSFIITNPTLAGERMLLIPKVSILLEQLINCHRDRSADTSETPDGQEPGGKRPEGISREIIQSQDLMDWRTDWAVSMQK